MLIELVLVTIGIETTSFVAIFSIRFGNWTYATRLSLGNFARGVLLMIFKPIKTGDLIEDQGELGVVKEIKIFTTKLLTLTNKVVIIHNGALSNGNITNYSTEGKLRVDLTFGVCYESDIKTTKNVLMQVLTSHPKVLKEPAPTVNVSELADSSINFAVRPWSTVADFWDVYFGIIENTKEVLDAAGI